VASGTWYFHPDGTLKQTIPANSIVDVGYGDDQGLNPMYRSGGVIVAVLRMEVPYEVKTYSDWTQNALSGSTLQIADFIWALPAGMIFPEIHQGQGWSLTIDKRETSYDYGIGQVMYGANFRVNLP
jgi:hypothetical protein